MTPAARGPRLRLAPLLALALFTALLQPSGCGGPDIPDGAFECAAEEPKCPPDFYCGGDDRCYAFDGDGESSDATCGDGTCDESESCSSCEGDCGAC